MPYKKTPKAYLRVVSFLTLLEKLVFPSFLSTKVAPCLVQFSGGAQNESEKATVKGDSFAMHLFAITLLSELSPV